MRIHIPQTNSYEPLHKMGKAKQQDIGYGRRKKGKKKLTLQSLPHNCYHTSCVERPWTTVINIFLVVWKTTSAGKKHTTKKCRNKVKKQNKIWCYKRQNAKGKKKTPPASQKGKRKKISELLVRSYRTTILRGLNFPPTALHSPQLPLLPELKAHSSQKPDIHSVHAKASWIGVRLSQVAHKSLRGLGMGNSEAEVDGGEAVGASEGWDDDAVAGGDSGVCCYKC